MARPRRAGPTRSIFMITVVDQVRPWFTPSSTLAATTQPQPGAQINSGGIGRAASPPAARTRLRPNPAHNVPAEKVLVALAPPQAQMERRALGDSAHLD